MGAPFEGMPSVNDALRWITSLRGANKGESHALDRATQSGHMPDRGPWATQAAGDRLTCSRSTVFTRTDRFARGHRRRSPDASGRAGHALFYLITIAGALKDIRDKRSE